MIELFFNMIFGRRIVRVEVEKANFRLDSIMVFQSNKNTPLVV